MITGSEFYLQVLHYILRIPHGRVATYGQIAKLAGKPQGSRGVAWILHSSSTVHKLPWHRVLNAQGKISFEKKSHNFRRQKSLLIKEGVEVSIDGKLSLSRFQWKKLPKKKVSRRKTPKMFADD